MKVGLHDTDDINKQNRVSVYDETVNCDGMIADESTLPNSVFQKEIIHYVFCCKPSQALGLRTSLQEL